jgi:hypothetical protein
VGSPLPPRRDTRPVDTHIEHMYVLSLGACD